MSTAAPATGGGKPQSYELIPANRRNLAAIVMALSNFMVVLDLTIANVAVPHIAGNLGISPDQGTWVITSYAVAEAVVVPLTGWLAQRIGTVRLFVASMVGFSFFSLLCGLAPTLGMLVACRIGQGLCGGPIMPMSQTLLLSVFPPEGRSRAVSLWAMTTLAGPAMGPIIGGYITDNYSWHWIFFINLPVGVICTTAAWALLRPVETPTRRVPIDKIGLLLLIFWIGSLQLMLDLGRDRDWFGDPLIVFLGALALIGFLVFMIWELTEKNPIVDLTVFANRSFSAGVGSFAICFGAYFASVVVIPQWLQTSMGYTAMDAGFATAFTAMTAILMAPVASRLMGKVDPRFMISGAFVWLALMSVWRAHWTTNMGFWDMAMPQIIQGFGMPFFMIPLTQITLSSLPPDKTASGAGLQNFLRTMAVAVATSLVLTLWNDDQRVARSELVSKVHTDDSWSALIAQGFGTEQARQTISNIVEQEAVTLAVNNTFWVTSAILLFAAGLVWLSPKPKGPPPPPGAGGH